VSETHTVVQGEHLSGIADQYGFSNYLTIWNHPQNAALKSLRKNPNILFPGDQVFIPEREVKKESRPTDKSHKFKLPAGPLTLRIVLVRIYDKPYANTQCVLRMGATLANLVSDGTGKVEQVIDKSLVNASLLVKDQIVLKTTTVPVEREIQLRVGFLDPVEEKTGQRARLANLGYYRAAIEPGDDDEFLSAVEEFQCENGLGVDGICGPLTQAKLIAVHGC